MMILYRLFFSLFFLCACTTVSAKDLQLTGSVASAHPLATEAGLTILEKGGNAFDAAIAVASTLNVVEPMMSGLGGYGTLLIYDANEKQIRYLNAGGRFPVNTDSDLMRAPAADYMKNRKGPKSISTPSNLNAWKDMHENYGKMPWSSLFEGAIFHAKNGFKIPTHAAQWIQASFDDFSAYSKSFYAKEGRPLQEGNLLVQADLAKTYELIAEKGVEPFYRGEIAVRIDNQMKEIGSFLSIEDLQNDKAEWRDPVKLNYRGYDVYTAGFPGNAFSALFILGVMQQFPLENVQHNLEDYLHLLAEVQKESCKVRLTNPGDQADKINRILSDNYFRSVASGIDRTKASGFVLPPGKEGSNTTHFVVVDKWGNIVSATQTLGTMFGSKVMIEGTGIWMNNSMAFSTFEPKGNPMDVQPGKYKLSSNSPIIILKDGSPWAALGTPGGHTIPQNVPQIIFNLIDFKMGMQEAIDAPKITFLEEQNLMRIEDGVPSDGVEVLKKMGHQVDSGSIGNATGIKLLNGQDTPSFDVGIDKRRDGQSPIYKASI